MCRSMSSRGEARQAGLVSLSRAFPAVKRQWLDTTCTTCLTVYDPLPGVQHPGFDFSGATVNGEAPEANAFLGGMRT